MNVVRVEFVSHYVDEMMIVVMEKFVKILFVRLDVEPMHIAPEIWHVLVKNALIHALNQRLVDRMQIVSFKIM